MNKLNFILDLDQTLISAEPTEGYDFTKNKAKAKKFIFHDMDGYYIVFERPGLQQFLTYLFDNFNVSIWTAASKDYALFVIEKIILAGNANRKLDYIFFSYHCDISSSVKSGSKDLSMFWDIYKMIGYTKDNTIILDDYDEVYKTQPENCIIAKSFEFTEEKSPEDTFLQDLVCKLKILVYKVKNKEKLSNIVKKINQ